ncbi:hypothetical protein MGEO_20080 [Marivita geojedonensis]|uniref:Uncharacterized protein n=2 Tax=Marivita geojedonensis TaxID=1123756 RepID=A0A1X4N9H7_9RHOB|nr:hypothetical protein [Marivita geojedonensis]OSQ42923.1 hypothetical protein MGEO_20080 [Marivita geojedonensis]
MTAGIMVLMGTSQVRANDDLRFSSELEMEIGIETIVGSDDPDEEYRDAYASVEASFEYELSEAMTRVRTH